MNIIPELRTLIKEYTIGYRVTEETINHIEELWEGDERFKTGTYKSWYPNGNLRYEVNYVYGRVYGISKSFYPNGCIGYLCIRDKICVQVEWHENGNLYKDHKYGTKNSILRVWYLDGRIKSEEWYDNNKKHGITKVYKYFNGVLFLQTTEHKNNYIINRKEEVINHQDESRFTGGKSNYLENRYKYNTGINIKEEDIINSSLTNRDLLEVNLTT